MTLLHAGGLLLLFFVLLVLELFIPSGGRLGIAAAAALIAAIVIGFLHSFTAGGLILISVSLLAPLVISIALRVWPRTAIGRRMLNIDPADDDDRRGEVEAARSKWIGKVGVAKIDLLPNGVIDIGGARIDAVSLSGVIDRGAHVEVVNVVAGKFQVRRTERPLTPADSPPGHVGDSPSPEDALEVSIESLGIEDLDDPLR